MRLEPVPLLTTLRDLWTMPRDMARFHAYLAKVTGGEEGEVMLPLVAANPMAKAHMVEYVDRLLVLDAERLVAEACAEAAHRLAHGSLDTRLSLVPADNIGGAWSEMTLMDFDNRFPGRLGKRGTLSKYRYLTALVFASEAPSPELIRQRVLAAAYRAEFSAAHGPAFTVRAMVRQEGNALRFAGLRETQGVDVDAVRAALAPHLDATDTATRFAAMYGDAAARRVGHKPLGVSPPNGGFILALADALRDPTPPEGHL